MLGRCSTAVEKVKAILSSDKKLTCTMICAPDAYAICHNALYHPHAYICPCTGSLLAKYASNLQTQIQNRQMLVRAIHKPLVRL